MRKKSYIIYYFTNPLVLFLSLITGILIGYFFPHYVEGFKVVGDLFLRVIGLISIPIIITSLISSSGVLIHSPQFSRVYKRLLKWFIFFGVIIAIVGGAFGLLGVNVANDTLGDNIKPFLFNGTFFKDFSITKIIETYIPGNIYNLILNSNYWQITLLSIVLGFAIGLIKHGRSDFLIDMTDGIYLGLSKIAHWILILVPFAIIVLTSNIFSILDREVIGKLLSVFILFYSFVFSFIIIGFFIIYKRSQQDIKVVLRSYILPLLISIISTNPLVIIPYTLKSLSNELKFNRDTINFYTPIAYILGNFGTLFFVAFISMLLLGLSGFSVSILSFSTIVLGSIILSILNPGFSTGVLLSSIILLLNSFNFNIESIVAIIISVDFLFAPARGIISTVSVFITSSFIAEPNCYLLEDITPGVILQNIPENINLKSYFRNYEGEIPIIDIKNNEFIQSVFPKARLKVYKKWNSVEELWNRYELNIVLGEKDYMKNISEERCDEGRYVVLTKRH